MEVPPRILQTGGGQTGDVLPAHAQKGVTRETTANDSVDTDKPYQNLLLFNSKEGLGSTPYSVDSGKDKVARLVVAYAKPSR